MSLIIHFQSKLAKINDLTDEVVGFRGEGSDSLRKCFEEWDVLLSYCYAQKKPHYF